MLNHSETRNSVMQQQGVKNVGTRVDNNTHTNTEEVTEALNRMYDLNDDAQEDSDEQKNKPCK